MGGQGLKIGLIVGALALAVVIWTLNSGSSTPSIVEEQVDLVCENCGAHFQINSKELKDKVVSVESPAGESGHTRRAGLGRSLFMCPKCDQPKAVVAHHCPTHDKYFAAETADGKQGKCPDCP